jgi:hypothetical protein
MLGAALEAEPVEGVEVYHGMDLHAGQDWKSASGVCIFRLPAYSIHAPPVPLLGPAVAFQAAFCPLTCAGGQEAR